MVAYHVKTHPLVTPVSQIIILTSLWDTALLIVVSTKLLSMEIVNVLEAHTESMESAPNVLQLNIMNLL